MKDNFKLRELLFIDVELLERIETELEDYLSSSEYDYGKCRTIDELEKAGELQGTVLLEVRNLLNTVKGE